MLPTFEKYTTLSDKMLNKIPEFKRILEAHLHPDWIHASELCVLLGWNKDSTSNIRNIVAYLRVEESYPICSEQSGYCMATQPEHLDLTISQLQGREYKTRMCIIGANNAQSRLAMSKGGQESMFSRNEVVSP